MSSQFITETSVAGLRLISAGDRIALDNYVQIRELIVSELGIEVADIFAEPDTVNGIDYAWLTERQGQIRLATDLSRNEYIRAAELAHDYLKKIQVLAGGYLNGGTKSQRDLGTILASAASIPNNHWDQYLFIVGGQPVFVNWGTQEEGQRGEGAPIEIDRKELLRPSNPRKFLVLPSMAWFWWLIFITLSSIIFLRLVDGCALFKVLGGVPNYCKVELRGEYLDIKKLFDERKQLEKSEYLLNSRIVAAPLCGSSSPAHVLKPCCQQKLKVTEPRRYTDKQSQFHSIPLLPSDLANDDANSSVASAEYNRTINDLIRTSGGAPCEGVEVIALWNQPVDIDLFVYCPVDKLVNDDIPDDRVVGPHNIQSCGAVYDIESKGDVLSGAFLERVCLEGNVETGEYLAGIYHDNPEGGDLSIDITLIARGAGAVHEISVKSKPGEESDDFLPIIIVP